MHHEISMSLLCLTGFLERLLRRNAFKMLKNESILDEAKKSLSSTSQFSLENLPASSKRWNALLSKMNDDIHGFKSVREAITYAQKKMPFDHRSNASIVYNYFYLYEMQLINEFPNYKNAIQLMGDSIYSRPNSLYRGRNGRLVSNIFYWHLRHLLVCLIHVNTPGIVAEIGGGYGSLARIWMTNPIHCPKTYILIDFPESLFFAEVFLKLNLQNTQIVYVNDEKTIDLNNATNTVYLVPIHLVNSLANLDKPIDLIINTGSMQEMSEEWIDFWKHWLDTVNCNYFYSLNYSSSHLSDWREGANAWSPRFSKKWVFRLNRINPYFIKLQCLDNMAEIIAEKLPESYQWNENLLQEKYKSLKAQYFDLQNFQDSLDIVRVTNDQEILLDVLTRCDEELPYLPKESYWILEALINNLTNEFLDNHKNKFERLKHKIHEQYNQAQKDYVHPNALK